MEQQNLKLNYSLIKLLNTLNKNHLYHLNIICISQMSMLITYINYNLLCVTSNNLLSAPASRKFQEFSLEKRSFCLILNKRNDLLKLAVEENLRERDRFISPHGVTGALEISGKTLLVDAAFVN